MRIAKMSSAGLALLIVSAAVPCFAQGPMGLGYLAQIGEELNVTEEQSARIQTMMMEMWRNVGEEMQDLTDEERREKMQEMRTEMEEKVAEVLSPEQNQRGREIRLQMEGARALEREDVQDELGLTREQISQAEAVSDRLREQFEELGRIARNGSPEEREGVREQFEELMERAERAADHILTEEQRAKLEEMKGEPFEFRRPEQGSRGPTLFQGRSLGGFQYHRPEREAPTNEGRNTGAFPRGGDQ